MDMSLRDHLRLIAKKLWLIAIIVVICCATAGVYSKYFVDPVYEASAQMLINQSASQPATAKNGAQTTDQQTLDINEVNTNIALVATYKVVLVSAYMMQKVVDRHPEFGLTAEALQGKVKINSVTNTQVISLIVSDHEYARAVKIANAVSNVFQGEISHVMKVDNVIILDSAKEDKQPGPVKPNLKMNVTVAFLLATLVSIGLVYLLAFFDRTLKSEEEIAEYLELPMLAATPKIKKVKAGSAAPQRQVGEKASATATH